MSNFARKVLNIPYSVSRLWCHIVWGILFQFGDDLLLGCCLGLGFCKRRGRAMFWTIYAAAVGLQMMLLVATLRFISGWSRGLLKGLLWVGLGLFRAGLRFSDGFGLV